MNTDTLLIIAALGAAAFMVMTPKRAVAAPAARMPSPIMTAGASASNIWNDAATAAYRAQLQRELTQGYQDQGLYF